MPSADDPPPETMSLHAEMTLDGRLWTPGAWVVGTVKTLMWGVADHGRSWCESECVAVSYTGGRDGTQGTIWAQVAP